MTDNSDPRRKDPVTNTVYPPPVERSSNAIWFVLGAVIVVALIALAISWERAPVAPPAPTPAVIETPAATPAPAPAPAPSAPPSGTAAPAAPSPAPAPAPAPATPAPAQ